jgi:hypothetical protein
MERISTLRLMVRQNLRGPALNFAAGRGAAIMTMMQIEKMSEDEATELVDDVLRGFEQEAQAAVASAMRREGLKR